MIHVVGISEMKISNTKDDVLITYSLGSCIGLTLFDPVAQIGGLIHSMLPLSRIDPEKSKAKPLMFTDTGVAALLQAMFDLGADRKNLIAKVVGAASIMDDKGIFKIGERNYTVMRKILWKNNILITGEDVGGTTARTLYLYMDTGKTVIKINNQLKEI